MCIKCWEEKKEWGKVNISVNDDKITFHCYKCGTNETFKIDPNGKSSVETEEEFDKINKKELFKREILGRQY